MDTCKCGKTKIQITMVSGLPWVDIRIGCPICKDTAKATRATA